MVQRIVHCCARAHKDKRSDTCDLPRTAHDHKYDTDVTYRSYNAITRDVATYAARKVAYVCFVSNQQGALPQTAPFLRDSQRAPLPSSDRFLLQDQGT